MIERLLVWALAAQRRLSLLADRSVSYRTFRRRLRNRRQYDSWTIHERMVGDRPRVDAYARAIAKYVTPGDIVLDVGTGSGILAMLAARRRAKRVYAVDHSAMIRTARVTARWNRLTNITFIRAHSSTVRLPEKVDILVHEQMGNTLFGESMLETVLDARDRLLKPGGRILPARMELFIEPVQLKEDRRVPFLWEQRVHGIDFAPLVTYPRQRFPNHAYTNVRPDDIACLLCNPNPVLAIDLENVRVDDLPTALSYRNVVVREGRLDGFVVYFRATFDDEISLSTSPADPGRAWHWTSTIYRVPARSHQPGDTIAFTIAMQELRSMRTWEWRYER